MVARINEPAFENACTFPTIEYIIAFKQLWQAVSDLVPISKETLTPAQCNHVSACLLNSNWHACQYPAQALGALFFVARTI